MIIFKLPDNRQSFDGVSFTTIVDENIRFEVEPTRRPVEKGADITDHLRELPIQVRISGLLVNGEDDQEAERNYWRLRSTMEARQLVTLYTTFDVLNDMAVQSIDITRRGLNGMDVDVSLIQVRTVEVDSADVPAGISKNKAGRPAGAGPIKNRGAVQSNKVVEDNKVIKQKSLALKGLDNAIEVFKAL